MIKGGGEKKGRKKGQWKGERKKVKKKEEMGKRGPMENNKLKNFCQRRQYSLLSVKQPNRIKSENKK